MRNILRFIFILILLVTMKKFLAIIGVFSVLLLTACAGEKPLTEAQQATKYGLTLEQYREDKIAAARMNMTWDEHQKWKKEQAAAGKPTDVMDMKK